MNSANSANQPTILRLRMGFYRIKWVFEGYNIVNSAYTYLL